MRVNGIRVADAPRRLGYVRLTADVTYEGEEEPEAYWFEVSRELASDLSVSGDPWLVALLPLAASRSEPLRVEGDVDGELVERARRLVRIWQSWYPGLGPVPIEATVRGDRAVPRTERSAAFFSGGVDSSFTAVRAAASAASGDGDPDRRIDDLITVGGFDIRLREERAMERLRERAARVAADLEMRAVEVRTNLRETEWCRVDWGRLGHGCAMGAVGLALESRYRCIRIAATGGYRDLHPWGSHPLTDPLMSTRALRFVHDGAAHTRVEKIRRLAGCPAVLDNLRVCFESGTAENCGSCLKCLLTMLTLELLGVLDRCPTLSGGTVDLRLLRTVSCRHPWDYRKVRDVRDLAADMGRQDVERALSRLMVRSRGRALGSRMAARARHEVARLGSTLRSMRDAAATLLG